LSFSLQKDEAQRPDAQILLVRKRAVVVVVVVACLCLMLNLTNFGCDRTIRSLRAMLM